MISKKNLSLLLVVVSVLTYSMLYYGIDRSQFLVLVSGVGVLGFSYFYWLKFNPFTFLYIAVIGVLFRIIFLFGSPNFSDDFYRFSWDGKLQTSGINPYQKTPTQIIESHEEFSTDYNKNLYQKLNSKEYHTVYPPINQYLFFISDSLSNGNLTYSVIWMKLLILFFEIGTLFVLYLILRHLKLPESLSQIYFLNPLVIIELSGNIHFEGVMLFFLLLGLFFCLKNQILFAGIAFGLAISVKLIPLILLPLFLPLLGFKSSFKFYLTIAISFVITFMPFVSMSFFTDTINTVPSSTHSGLLANFSESVGLYFQTFEFNASFYYLFKAISYSILGYKSSLIGIVIPIVVFLFALFLTFRLNQKQQTNNLLNFDLHRFTSFAIPLLMVYYLLASTIHPWYVINLVVFVVFIPNRAILVWSFTVFLSYFAYSSFVVNLAPQADFHSYYWYYVVIFLEYSALLYFFFLEKPWYNKKQNNK